MDDLSLLQDSQEERNDQTPLNRKSMSQPVLPQGPSTSSQNVRNIPIIQTWHENEELKGKMYTLRCEVDMYKHRYEMAKETMHQSVQNVLDEYVTLKLNQDDADQKIRDFQVVNQQLIDLREKYDDMKFKLDEKDAEIRRLQEEFDRKLSEFERTPNPESSLNLTTSSFKGTLDDILKKDDPDFTLVGPDDKKIMELEDKLFTEMEKVFNLQKLVDELRDDLSEKSARLAESDNQRIQLLASKGQGILGMANESKTFVIGDGRDSLTTEQLAYIDELEKNLKITRENLEKTTCALGEYMNKVSRLERELHNLKKNNTFDTSSYLYDAKTAEELKAQIARTNAELNILRTENRNLRIRCDRMNGGLGNVSDSFGHSRLLAGISAHATGRASTTSSMDVQQNEHNESSRVFPPQLLRNNSELSENDSCLMDLSSARRMNAEDNENFEAAVAQFQEYMATRNDSLECSLNESVPAVIGSSDSEKRESMNSRTSSALTTIPAHESSSRRLPTHLDIPLLQEVQNILDTSAALIEGNQVASMDVEKMQAKMLAVREALTRLFDRLKSSAALFEEILEKMGSSSPMADQIQKMKLAFENSICDHEDVSQFLEAAEQDLNNLSLNFSVLEKSIMNQSAIADISRRFSIAPNANDILSSSINLNNSQYSPVFKFQNGNAEIEKLNKQIEELREELARTRRSSSSTPEVLQRQLTDTQVKASKNFEDLEVCQATLNRVESEKLKIERELRELNGRYSNIEARLGETEHELRESMKIIEEERKVRKDQETVANNSIMELRQQINAYQENLTQNGNISKSLEKELKEALDAENELRDAYEELSKEAEHLKVLLSDSESKFVSTCRENRKLNDELNEMEVEIQRLRKFEEEQTDLNKKTEKAENRRSAQFDSYARSTQTLEESKKEDNTVELTELKSFETEAIQGLQSIQNELSGLVEKKLKIKICAGNVSSIRLGCQEICKRLEQEQVRRHEHAEVLRQVNDTLEKKTETLAIVMSSNKVGQENIEPQSSSNVLSDEKKKYRDPTRQLLHDATQAIDAIVQKMKKTVNLEGMTGELKPTIAAILVDSRHLRDFLHQKFMLFKSVDISHIRNESCTYEQLLQRLEKSYQDFVIVDEECRKLKHEMKKMKASIPSLGTDVESRIKKEIGGIARDMGAVNSLRK